MCVSLITAPYIQHDMQHLLKEVHKAIEQSGDPNPLICGVGLGGYWSERIGFCVE